MKKTVLFLVVTLLVVVSLFAGQWVTLAAGSAIYTTDSCGSTVNQNQFSSKDAVYLNGGPSGGQGLSQGEYYVRVTDPSGKNVLGASKDAVITVKADGTWEGTCHRLWDMVYKSSDSNAPGYDDSTNGEYKVEVSQDPNYREGIQKTDNFKVGPEPTATSVPPTSTSVPPTSTSVPPTSTSVPPTSTSVPPTSTSVPPTSTSVPPTSTSVPPTSTSVPPTSTAVPPTPTNTPQPNPPTPTNTPQPSGPEPQPTNTPAPSVEVLAPPPPPTVMPTPTVFVQVLAPALPKSGGLPIGGAELTILGILLSGLGVVTRRLIR